jgi:hypothetical protein
MVNNRKYVNRKNSEMHTDNPELVIPDTFRILLDVAKMTGWSVRDLLDTAHYICENEKRLLELSRIELHYLLNEKIWPQDETRPVYIEL